ncbi:C40 family peptidase [Evansella cellulosilytica]|uniref:NLP/P60 protein n=1 Tax=Evansella cellulosilytica (strain ATCC 21833 / DSM 2522 / FERM P-1141 / JCM 9156 / N-4) TaxID=649639 RepID=E6U273_EVAC2|nr:C40 family peptidase [Evansella cellulosilytica]ADU30451.1 NLP/P60 protein [Evansella cellulosilytica DSM 2522]
MNKQKKSSFRSKVVSLFVLIFVFNALVVGQASAYEQVPTAGVAVNGEMVDGIDPIKLNGEYYVPLINMAKILGYNHIQFESNTKTYEMTDGSTVVRTTMGGTRARRGDEFMNIDAPRWLNETAYVSLDAASALFNSYIYFKAENGSVQVEKPAQKYEVHAGDSLWRIAQAHHTTIQAIKDANNLTSNIIYPGQLLKLPARDKVKETEPVKEKQPVEVKDPAPTKDIRTQILNEAQQYIGAGYKFGATLNEAPNLFDCSSYTQFVFGNLGIQLPRTSREQAQLGTTVSLNNLQPGDLVFFTNHDLYSDGRVGHLGIYMGNGDMIHASSSRGVHIATNFMDINYWKNNYVFSKRIID